MDLKVMPRSQKGHKFILCIIGEVTNYLITIPIHHSGSEEVGESIDSTCYIGILCSQLHYNGSRQCIYVYSNELLIQEAKYKD